MTAAQLNPENGSALNPADRLELIPPPIDPIANRRASRGYITITYMITAETYDEAVALLESVPQGAPGWRFVGRSRQSDGRWIGVINEDCGD